MLYHVRAVSAFALLVLLPFALPAGLHAQERAQFDLPSQPLAESLKALGIQTRINVLVNPKLVDRLSAPALKASLTMSEALTRLLSGTDLEYRFVDDQTVVIREKKAEQTTAAAASQEEIRLAQADAQSESIRKVEGSSAENPASTRNQNMPRLLASEEKDTQEEEIIVTAQKRSERLQDVPVPVTAIRADALVNSNQLRLQDFYSSIPAFNATINEFGAAQVTIRGLTTGGFTAPTVGFVVDDVSYGPTSPFAYGENAPDFDPSELARIEVLRGPQGTFYGASSLGGLVKYVTVDPSTQSLSGRIQAGISGVKSGDDIGYNARGSINVPLSETLAVRASAFTRQDAGYIDDPVLGEEDVNEGSTDGGRLSALWNPSDRLSLKVGALFQRAQMEASSAVIVQPGLADLEQSNARGSGQSDIKLQAYSANLTAQRGDVQFVSLTGYNITDLKQAFDLTPLLGQFVTLPIFGVTGTTLVDDYRTTKFTQELRFSGVLGPRTDWLLGAYYNDESTTGPEDVLATDFQTGEPAGLVGRFSSPPKTFTEYAAFANLTFHLTDRFDIQVGGRESQHKQHFQQTVSGVYAALFLGGDPSVSQDVRTKENSFTYLLTPRFKLSPDVMLYARFASGYRPGGANSNTSPVLPPTYDADETLNYEVGIKGEALDGALAFDGSVYYIDWKDVQLRLLDPISGASFFANGGRARSQGIELALESRPRAGLSIAAWGAWNDAELSEDFPPTSQLLGNSGDRLPYGSRVSGSLSVEQQFALTSSATAFVGASVSYVGDREGTIPVRATPPFPQTPRQTYPSYTKADLRAGAMFDSWSLNFFVNNVTDERGVIGGGFGTLNPAAFTLIQPRTVGASLSKTF